MPTEQQKSHPKRNANPTFWIKPSFSFITCFVPRLPQAVTIGAWSLHPSCEMHIVKIYQAEGFHKSETNNSQNCSESRLASALIWEAKRQNFQQFKQLEIASRAVRAFCCAANRAIHHCHHPAPSPGGYSLQLDASWHKYWRQNAPTLLTPLMISMLCYTACEHQLSLPYFCFHTIIKAS